LCQWGYWDPRKKQELDVAIVAILQAELKKAMRKGLKVNSVNICELTCLNQGLIFLDNNFINDFLTHVCSSKTIEVTVT